MATEFEDSTPADDDTDRGQSYYFIKLARAIPAEGLLISDDQSRRSVALGKFAQQYLRISRPSAARLVTLMQNGMRPVEMPATHKKGGSGGE